MTIHKYLHKIVMACAALFWASCDDNSVKCSVPDSMFSGNSSSSAENTSSSFQASSSSFETSASSSSIEKISSSQESSSSGPCENTSWHACPDRRWERPPRA